MEKRSRRRIRDLVALAAFQGLSENEIGCARISMMARSDAAPFKGRIQKRKTNHLQIITFGLQRTAGPYRWPGAILLRSRAGYRSARPIISRSSHSACNARPVHTKVPSTDVIASEFRSPGLGAAAVEVLRSIRPPGPSNHPVSKRGLANCQLVSPWSVITL